MEIPVKGKSIVDATLQSENAVLNDVVLVGYTSKQKSQISSSVSIVSGAFWSRTHHLMPKHIVFIFVSLKPVMSILIPLAAITSRVVNDVLAGYA